MNFNFAERWVLKTITMVEFRRNAGGVLELVRKGQRVLLTYRGKPAVVMEPASVGQAPSADDPFYRLPESAEPAGGTLSNERMDELIYGE